MEKDTLSEQIGIRFYKQDLPKIQEKAKIERTNLSEYIRKVVAIAVDDK